MADEAHMLLLDRVGVILSELSLDGLEATATMRLSMQGGWQTNLPAYPCVVYSPDGTFLSMEGDTQREQWGYPVTIRILARQPVDDLTFAPSLLRWRRTIRDAFHKQPTGIALVSGDAYGWLVQSGPTVETTGVAEMLLSSPIFLQALTLEPRP